MQTETKDLVRGSEPALRSLPLVTDRPLPGWPILALAAWIHVVVLVASEPFDLLEETWPLSSRPIMCCFCSFILRGKSHFPHFCVLWGRIVPHDSVAQTPIIISHLLFYPSYTSLYCPQGYPKRPNEIPHKTALPLFKSYQGNGSILQLSDGDSL